MSADYYDELCEAADPARAVGWRNRLEQALRFEAVADLIDAPPHPHSLVDIGCGDAALADYLEATGRRVVYTGVERHPTLAARARSRCPRAVIIEADALSGELPGGDVVVAIGALVSGQPLSDEARRTRLQELVASLWGACQHRAALVVLAPEALAERPGLALEPALVGATAAELTAAAKACGATEFMVDEAVTALDRMLVMAKPAANLPRLRSAARRVDAVLGSTWAEQSELDAHAWLAWEAGVPERARELLEHAGDTALALLLRERIAAG